MKFSALILTLSLSLVACSSGDSPSIADSTATRTSAESDNGEGKNVANTGPITLTAADIDGFEKGIARETQLVREAQQRANSATTPQARGEASQAAFEINTIPAAAPVTGLSADRYKLVRETIATIMTTLDFQGQIDGPQSLDTARASPDMKARLSSDPYTAVNSEGAALLKSRLSRIAPLWIEYINLTVVGG